MSVRFFFSFLCLLFFTCINASGLDWKSGIKATIKTLESSPPYFAKAHFINFTSDKKIKDVLDVRLISFKKTPKRIIFKLKTKTRTVYMPVLVSWKSKVLVARNNIGFNRELFLSDLKEEKNWDVTGKNSPWLTSFKDISNSLSLSFIKKGNLIYVSQIKKIPSVRNRTKVRVVLDSIYFTVERFGLSLSNGYIGDNIRIKVGDKGKIITARVIGAGTVRVNGF